MGKIDEAIAKITGECEHKEYLIPFEEYLSTVCTNDLVAEKILKEDRTLDGCFEEMKAIAKRRQKNGCAYIPPEEGFEIIEKYYGITGDDKQAGYVNFNNNVIDITDLML